MNKVYYLLIIVLAHSLVACSSDDDNKQSTSELVGKWMNTEIRMEGELTVDGVNLEINGVGMDNNSERNLTFYSDYTFEANTLPMPVTFLLNIGDTEYNIVQDINVDMPQFGEWLKDGETLLMISNGEAVDFKVESLNLNSLLLSRDNINMRFSLENGEIGVYEGDNIKMTLLFERL